MMFKVFTVIAVCAQGGLVIRDFADGSSATSKEAQLEQAKALHLGDPNGHTTVSKSEHEEIMKAQAYDK